MTTCPECDHSLSSTARACPHCGVETATAEDAARRSRSGWFFLIVVVLVLAVGGVLWHVSNADQAKTDKSVCAVNEALGEPC